MEFDLNNMEISLTNVIILIFGWKVDFITFKVGEHAAPVLAVMFRVRVRDRVSNVGTNGRSNQ